jgi:hypothetical protein
MPRGTKKTDVRQRFLKQIDRIKYLAQQFDSAMINGEKTADWMMPDPNGWDGNLFDVPGMKEPFDRKEHDEDFNEIVKSGVSPGVLADLASVQLQGDFLAAMERAFRERHKSHVRSMIHASARQAGHHSALIDKMLVGHIKRQLSKGAG